MQDNVVICKTFCFPDPEQGIDVQKIAVNGKGNVGAARYIIFPHIRAQPAFQPPALIVISPGAFLLKFASGLKSIDKKIPDVFSCFGKTPYQFLKIGHHISSCVHFVLSSHYKGRNIKFATFLK